MIPIGCNCNKTAKTGKGLAATAGPTTYRVMVGGRQVYESSNKTAADTVAGRFDDAKVLAPGVTA